MDGLVISLMVMLLANSLKAMEDLKLSQSTTLSDTSISSMISSCKKRKYFTGDHHLPIYQTSIELDPIDPLPLHWEQCLDLHSGRMYYLNRKTLRKSWSRPKEQKLDLELNISSSFSSSKKRTEEEYYSCYSWNKLNDSMSSNNANMVAVACANCHLLVMLCKSSPSCPNCKYMHYSLPMYHATKSDLKTLSLLH
ncbi:putative WW domain-containing protein [Dioscorea sansibarensis]